MTNKLRIFVEKTTTLGLDWSHEEDFPPVNNNGSIISTSKPKSFGVKHFAENIQGDLTVQTWHHSHSNICKPKKFEIKLTTFQNEPANYETSKKWLETLFEKAEEIDVFSSTPVKFCNWIFDEASVELVADFKTKDTTLSLITSTEHPIPTLQVPSSFTPSNFKISKLMLDSKKISRSNGRLPNYNLYLTPDSLISELEGNTTYLWAHTETKSIGLLRNNILCLLPKSDLLILRTYGVASERGIEGYINLNLTAQTREIHWSLNLNDKEHETMILQEIKKIWGLEKTS